MQMTISPILRRTQGCVSERWDLGRRIYSTTKKPPRNSRVGLPIVSDGVVSGVGPDSLVVFADELADEHHLVVDPERHVQVSGDILEQVAQPLDAGLDIRTRRAGDCHQSPFRDRRIVIRRACRGKEENQKCKAQHW